MNAPFFLCLIACIAAAVYARYRSNLEAAPAPKYGYKVKSSAPRLCDPCISLYGIEAVRAAYEAEYHIFHGPNDGCVECEGK